MECKTPRTASTQQALNHFTLLVSLNVRHDFFNAEAEVCRAVAVTPTPQTVQRLKQRKMAVLARDDGFDLLVSHRASTDAPARVRQAQGRHCRETNGAGTARLGLHVEPPLLFTMELRDLGFAQYTDMPPDLLPGAPPLRWSNRGARRIADRSGLITPDWSATVADAAPAPAAPGASPSMGSEADVERNAYAKNWQQFGLFDLHLPLLSPGGWAERDGDFVPPDLLLAALTDPGFKPLVYELRFTARLTVWRYIVTARDGRLAEDSLEIVDPTATSGGTSQKSAFKKLADRRQLPDGRTAVAFVSRRAMPLRQRTEHRFALRGLPIGGHMRQRTLVDPLPAASPRSTVFHVPVRSPPLPSGSRRSATPWSDIYVFV